MLRVHDHRVESVAAGQSSFRDGRLVLDLDRLRALILRDERIARAELHLVSPGDRTRVANVLDVFDARRKVDGPTFPGIDGAPLTAGSGDLHRFSNFQIVQIGVPPTGAGGLMVARRAFIDFWGEGAQWCPFSSAHSIVMDIAFDDALNDKAAADDAARRALVAVSTAIGDLAVESGDDGTVEEFGATWERSQRDGLPRVAYVYQVQSQGALLDTFLYGATLDGLYPTLLDPVELLDGAMVSGNHQRVTTATIHHCNNPVLSRLLADDGIRLNLLPVVLMEGHHKSTPAKVRSAEHAVQLLRCIGAQGAVFTQEGGGMSIVDQMLTIERARDAGIECVGVTNEMAGAEGTDRPLIYFTRAAKNLVSAGNRDELVHLEPPDTLIGGSGRNGGGDAAVDATTAGQTGATVRSGRSTEASEAADLTAPADLPLWVLYGAVSQVGAGRARAHSQ